MQEDAVRYEKGHKSETRARILETAARDFRHGGVPGVGLTKVMSDAGLTNGAFYAHFESKDALVREAVVFALAEQLRTFEGEADLVAVIAAYLSPEHRDAPEAGCISAAAITDLGRQSMETRDAYAAGLLEVLQTVAKELDDGDAQTRLDQAFAIFGSMLGCLQLARAVADPALSNRILQAGITAATTLARSPRR